MGQGVPVGTQGSREEGEGVQIDLEESATFWHAPWRDASPREGRDTKLVCRSRLEAGDESCGAVGARRAWTVSKEAAEHGRWGGASGEISFRATRVTAKPETVATRRPLGVQAAPTPPFFLLPSGLFASSQLRRPLLTVRVQSRLKPGAPR